MPASIREVVAKSVELKEAADKAELLQGRRQDAVAREQQAQDQLTAAIQEFQSQMTIVNKLRAGLKALLDQP